MIELLPWKMSPQMSVKSRQSVSRGLRTTNYVTKPPFLEFGLFARTMHFTVE